MGKDAANASGRGHLTKEDGDGLAIRFANHLGSIGRQALNWHPQGQGNRGKPRNTWRRELEKDIIRTGHTWKQLERVIAQDRGHWRVMIGGLCFGRSERQN